METQTYKLKVTFIEPILGSQPTRDVASEFIAGKAGIELPADEAATLPEALERGTTVFHKDANGNPLIFNYVVKGFLKAAAKVLNGRSGMPRNLKSKVDDTVFVTPRNIELRNDTGDLKEQIDFLERPLRAETAEGPRIALARSEMLPAGVSFECGLEVIKGEITEAVLTELLDYGYHKGIGQWRNGGYGSFRYELTSED